MLAAVWGSPLIVGDYVYIGDEDGDVCVFRLSADPKVAMQEIDGELQPINANEDGEVVNMGNSVYSTPVVANDVLFIANKDRLFAIVPRTPVAIADRAADVRVSHAQTRVLPSELCLADQMSLPVHGPTATSRRPE